MAKKELTAKQRREAEQKDGNPIGAGDPNDPRHGGEDHDAYVAAREAQNEDDFDADQDDEQEELDASHLPVNHATLLDARNVTEQGVIHPPEATPREGRTSPSVSPVGPRPTAAQRLAEDNEPVLVQATQMGYYGHARRRAGDVFYIARKADFSKRWMRAAPPGLEERITTPNQALKGAHDEILALKHGAVVRDDNPIDG